MVLFFLEVFPGDPMLLAWDTLTSQWLGALDIDNQVVWWKQLQPTVKGDLIHSFAHVNFIYWQCWHLAVEICNATSALTAVSSFYAHIRLFGAVKGIQQNFLHEYLFQPTWLKFCKLRSEPGSVVKAKNRWKENIFEYANIFCHVAIWRKKHVELNNSSFF